MRGASPVLAALNQKTARSLGFILSPMLLIRVDEVSACARSTC
jgi:hypothetical protein